MLGSRRYQDAYPVPVTNIIRKSNLAKITLFSNRFYSQALGAIDNEC